jgi:lipoate-protein ligase A
MKYIDLTLPTPQANLAADEALLDFCEEGHPDEILRFWESPQRFAVLGYSNKTQSEVNASACRTDGLPVLRRCTGGGAVVQGPGCLNFSLILRIPDSGPLAKITETNAFIMTRHQQALEPVFGSQIDIQGSSDLAIGTMKFSGNAQRRKRRYLLFHGTFLLDFDIPVLERLLPLPSRQPAYRQNRAHSDFLVNINAARSLVKETLTSLWGATETLNDVPLERIEALATDRYSSDEWNFRC